MGGRIRIHRLRGLRGHPAARLPPRILYSCVVVPFHIAVPGPLIPAPRVAERHEVSQRGSAAGVQLRIPLHKHRLGRPLRLHGEPLPLPWAGPCLHPPALGVTRLLLPHGGRGGRRLGPAHGLPGHGIRPPVLSDAVEVGPAWPLLRGPPCQFRRVVRDSAHHFLGLLPGERKEGTSVSPCNSLLPAFRRGQWFHSGSDVGPLRSGGDFTCPICRRFRRPLPEGRGLR